MTSKIKKILASLLALAALALGGAAIASATNGGSDGNQGAQEKAEGNESLPEGADDNGNDAKSEGADEQNGAQEGDHADKGEAVSDAAAAKASAAAIAKVGGTVQEVNAETHDGQAQEGDRDSGEKPLPAGTAYGVDLTKGSQEFKVALDKQFNVLQVQSAQSD